MVQNTSEIVLTIVGYISFDEFANGVKWLRKLNILKLDEEPEVKPPKPSTSSPKPPKLTRQNSLTQVLISISDRFN